MIMEKQFYDREKRIRMKRLLFVDDDADFLESNRLYFSKNGYDVLCTTSPKEALELLASANLDCIILDIDQRIENIT